MSLEERTLVVRNINSNYVTRDILEELFLQAGPVLNVVLRPDFAYIEFAHKCSVAYTLALMDGIRLFGQSLHLSPKIPDESYYHYVNSMNAFNYSMACNPNFFQQYLPNGIVTQNKANNYREGYHRYENNARYNSNSRLECDSRFDSSSHSGRRHYSRPQESSHTHEREFSSTYLDRNRQSAHNSRYDNYSNDCDRRQQWFDRHSHRDYDNRTKPSNHYRSQSYR